MLRTLLRPVTALALALPLLTSCGGGGDEAGARDTAFSIVPDTVTVTGNGACPSAPPGGYVVEVFIHGGVAPYTIKNTFPDLIVVNKTKVDNPGESFMVGYVSGACMDPGTLAVVDSLNRVVTFKLITKDGS